MVKITFPDGSSKDFKKGVSPLEIAKSVGEKLARGALAAKVNGVLVDLDYKINENSKVQILTFEDKDGKAVFWHSTNHILAQSVKELFPKAKLGIGPAIEQGFYYDFDHEPFSEQDLEKIEKRMKDIVEQDLKSKRLELKKAEAEKMFKDEPYRLELLKDMKEGEISAYEQGKNFIDLCRGPHIPRTGLVKAFKLIRTSGAYWRGKQNNKQLQRIYGISFPDKKQLKKYLKTLEEAKKRDHRVIGRELGLFTFHKESPGSPFFHDKGTVVFNELLKFIRDEYWKRGYKEVITPLIYDKSLWEVSGHWSHYKENMFVLEMDNKKAAVKPMNCPSHCLIYKTSTKSYRDLPLRIADFSVLHRNELKGVIGGLTRVRKFQQDDAHIFCTLDQIGREVLEVIDFVNYVYRKVFKFNFNIEISTKPEKALGTKEQWDKAESALKHALEESKIDYKLNPGDGAFYGPKIDVHVLDALGRSWQAATIQLDFNLPERFKLTYEGSDGKKHVPVIIHRAVLGSIERFMGILIEHYAGKFPLWLSPVHARLITVADRFNNYAEKIKQQLMHKKIRVELDSRTESVSKKVREAQLDKVPLILTIGEKEEKSHTLAVRTLDGKIKFGMKVDEFIKKTNENIKAKKQYVDFLK